MIRVFSQSNAAFSAVTAITRPVLAEYCSRHGYELHTTDSEDWQKSIVWDRYRIMVENSDGCDWMVHFDADILITNLHVRLEEFTPQNHRICMAKCLCDDDQMRLNDGVGIFASDAYTRWYLTNCYEIPHGDGIWCVQDVLQRDLDRGKLDGIIKLERQKSLNSFLYSEYGKPDSTKGNWTPGDFVLHPPGRSNERRVEIFSQKEKHVLR